MEDAPKLLKIPTSECPDIGFVFLDKWPKSLFSMEDPVVPLERNLYGHPLAGLSWERPFEKILLKYGWEKVSNWECLFVHRGKGPFSSVYVDGFKLAGKKQNIDPMWKVLNKEVDVGEPTSFLDHVHLGCTQSHCEISKDIVDNYRTMFDFRRAIEKLSRLENLSISSWSYGMEGHAKKCVERYCELANRTTQQLYKASTPCIDDHHFRRRRIEIRGRIVTSMLTNSFEILVLGTYWRTRYSVNKLARSITKWTKACDKRFSRLISYLHHTCEYKQYCFMGKTAKQCRLGRFQDSDFAGDLEDSKSTWGGTLCVFGSHTFVPISWMCKKQTSVSHSSSEAEIISLDTGLRLDGLPALELWDLIVSILGNVSRVSDRSEKPESDDHKHHKSHNKIDVMKDIDTVPSNVQSARQEALFYVFEDNEAVVKMITKGRNPTMRHVSRTHRVALDRLFDRINLEPKFQIKYIDTKKTNSQTYWPRETSHVMNGIIFLCLFNISHFSSTDCSGVMSKRTQKDSGERVTAKSKPMMNLVSRCSERTSDVLASTASESLGKTRHESEFDLSSRTEQHHTTGRLVEDAYSSSYSEWNVDKTWSSQEWKSDELMEGRTGRLVVVAQHTDSFIVENDNMNSYTEAESEMPFESRSFLHRVNDQVRKGQNHSSKDAAKDSDKHSVKWWMFVSSTLQASVFMVKNYSDNLQSKNTEDLTMTQMFDISEKSISEQSDEIYGVTPILTGKIFHGSIYLWSLVKKSSVSNTKVYVFFQILSVLCLGKMNENPQSNYACEDRLTWFKSSSQYRTLVTIDGEPMEFEWNIFPGFTTLQLVREVQEFLSKMSIQPEDFIGRIVFLSMFNDIPWRSKDNEQECELSAQLVSIYARRFSPGKWSFVGPGSEKKWYSIHEYKPQGEWESCWTSDDKICRKRTPSFPCYESFVTTNVEKQRWWQIINTLLRWWGNDWNCFRTIISVNQLSICGAVSDLCEECKTCHVRTERRVVAGQSDPLFVPTSSLMKTSTPSTDGSCARRNPLQRY